MSEVLEREAIVPDIARVIDEDLLAVSPSLAPLLFVQVIGKIGRQALRPIAPLLPDVHLVAEPLVEDFMPQGSLDDERKSHNVLAQEGVGGHGGAGREKILDDHKSLERKRQ